ncbi:MAG: hypothetical protein KC900_01980 [Candidatus Omnitrophica bacterium]|nr:hypothetical protein [Candidatus Omnitrophota bacterium]
MPTICFARSFLIILFVLADFTVTVENLHAAELPIMRQTEAEMENAFLQILSGKKVKRQGKDDSYPEQQEEWGRPFADYIKPGSVAEVFIPFEARLLMDADIERIFAEAVIVEYEKMKPMALKPCQLIRVTDKKDYNYDLCIFRDAPDLRGTLTFPNYQRFWFAVPPKTPQP